MQIGPAPNAPMAISTIHPTIARRMATTGLSGFPAASLSALGPGIAARPISGDTSIITMIVTMAGMASIRRAANTSTLIITLSYVEHFNGNEKRDGRGHSDRGANHEHGDHGHDHDHGH